MVDDLPINHRPSTIKVLIADDHDIVREGLKRLLTARADFW